jgi:hypothetical protein
MRDFRHYRRHHFFGRDRHSGRTVHHKPAMVALIPGRGGCKLCKINFWNIYKNLTDEWQLFYNGEDEGFLNTLVAALGRAVV